MLTHFQHGSGVVEIKKNLASLKILLESLDTDQIPIQDYWRLISERLIDDHGSVEGSNTSNLTLILDRLSGIKSKEFREKNLGKFFEVLKSFSNSSNEQTQRDVTLFVEQKLFSTCLTFVELNLSKFVEQKLDDFPAKDLWLLLVELSKEADLQVIYR